MHNKAITTRFLRAIYEGIIEHKAYDIQYADYENSSLFHTSEAELFNIYLSVRTNPTHIPIIPIGIGLGGTVACYYAESETMVVWYPEPSNASSLIKRISLSNPQLIPIIVDGMRSIIEDIISKYNDMYGFLLTHN